MAPPIQKLDSLPATPPPPAPKVYVAQKRNEGKEVTVTACLPEESSPSTFVNGPDRQLQTYVCRDGRRYTRVFLENKRDDAANDWKTWKYKFDGYGGWRSFRSRRDKGILVYPIKSLGWSGEVFETDSEMKEILIQKNLLNPGEPPKKTSFSRLTQEGRNQWVQKPCTTLKKVALLWAAPREVNAADVIGYGAQYLCESELSLGANVWLLRPLHVSQTGDKTDYQMAPWVWRAMDDQGTWKDLPTYTHWYQNDRMELIETADQNAFLDFLITKDYFTPPPNYWITSPNGEDHTFPINACRVESKQFLNQQRSQIVHGECPSEEGKPIPFYLTRYFSIEKNNISPPLIRYQATPWKRSAYSTQEMGKGFSKGNSVETPERNVLILMENGGTVLRDKAFIDETQRDKAIREAYQVPDNYDVRFLSFSLGGLERRDFEESSRGGLASLTITAHPLALMGSPLAGLTTIGSLELGSVSLEEGKDHFVGTGKLGLGIRLKETFGWSLPIDLSAHFYLFERGYHGFLGEWYQSYSSQGGGCFSTLWKHGSLDFCYDYQQLSMERTRETPTGLFTDRLGNSSIFSVRGSFDLGTEIQTMSVLEE